MDSPKKPNSTNPVGPILGSELDSLRIAGEVLPLASPLNQAQKGTTVSQNPPPLRRAHSCSPRVAGHHI